VHRGTEGERIRRLMARPFHRWSQSWLFAAAGLAAASFATLLAAIPGIFVPDTALGWVDAWYYVGFAQRLPESLRQYSTSLYQVERLSWIVPAYLLNQVASPLAANYLLKGAYFAVTVCMLFGALREICGFRTAAFVSALASLYSFVAHSLGANYVDGAANMYFLIAVYAVNHAAHSRNRVLAATLSAGAGGVAFAAVLLTQLAYVVVLPLFIAYAALVWVRSGSDRLPIVTAVASFLTGAVILGLLAGAVYVYWGIPGWPLRLSLGMLRGHEPNLLVLPTSQKWLLRAYWLLLPAAVAIWILPAVFDACRRGRRAALRLPPAYWFFLWVCSLWTFMYFLSAPWLMLPFYASFLIPATFLALGPAAAPLIERLSPGSFRALLGLLFAGSFAVYRYNSPRFAEEAALIASLCLILATMLRATNHFAVERRAAAALTFMVLALVSINAATADYTLQVRNGYTYTAMAVEYHEPNPSSRWPVSRAQAFDGAVRAAARLAPRLNGRHYYFWYDGDDPLGMLFRSVGSMFYAWSTRDLLNERFHGIDAETIKWLLPQRGGRVRDLIVLTRSADLPLQGSPLSLQWTQALSAAGTRFYAHYLVVDMVRAAGFDGTPRHIELASRFPCDPEMRAAALWYDRPLTTPRTSADSRALRDLFEAATKSPIQCFSAYARLTERLGEAERRSRYVPVAASCEQELSVAETYVSEVFDAALRGQTAALLESARAAQSEKQAESCRLAVADIRRAYFEAVYGATDPSAATSRLRLASVGIDFAPSPRRMRLAGGFPCLFETSAAGRWYDRPVGASRTSVDRQALEELFSAPRNGIMQCLSAYRTVTERLASEDHSSPYAPPTATCESELAVAETYAAVVFDETLRRRTLAALRIARNAQHERKEGLCRESVGDIRRKYFEAIYGPTNPDDGRADVDVITRSRRDRDGVH
jgi:hypothetical protein